MKFCQNCGGKISLREKFCGKCGSATNTKDQLKEKTKFCQNCGQEIIINEKFCGKCGSEITKENNITNTPNSDSINEQQSMTKIFIIKRIIQGIVSIFLLLFSFPLIFSGFVDLSDGYLKYGIQGLIFGFSFLLIVYLLNKKQIIKLKNRFSNKR